MVFCNTIIALNQSDDDKVTILILIDGFLQYLIIGHGLEVSMSHNPYFNRWFSAINFLGLIMY